MFRIALAAAIVATPALAAAQSGTAPQRIRSVTVDQGQKCPESTAEEVVVCRRAEEPYRIPPALRDSGPIAAQNQSWVNRAAAIDDVSRRAAGLPNTCSPIGTGGATGCSLQALQAYARDRKAGVDGAAQVP
ncbi:hypothetical protein [Sphingomonas rubra]|uniref:UrcA family protein n=1 Tax=Sphingomonas rubra TaxID=634430 RepID=A0A1I5PT07_9SPHN|nr:hypothetical protein [Sphingomonas rubra]SFP37155.1 hypothetical protein SAMN04488241_101208 [Sphingomonas rubra]